MRPSSLHPIRRRGPSAELNWDEGILLVRRPQTRRHEVMSATKTGRDQTIHLPPALVDVRRVHADALPPGRMRDSELLFPTERGDHRSGSCVTRPFLTIAKAIGLTSLVSPRTMRRTFQDPAREAGVRDVVTRAISGHATGSMQRHYSTARDHEITARLPRVFSLALVAGDVIDVPSATGCGQRRNLNAERSTTSACPRSASEIIGLRTIGGAPSHRVHVLRPEFLMSTPLLQAVMAVLDATPRKRLNIVLLNKALFYSDLLALRDLGSTITGAKYVAIKNGPVVRNYTKTIVDPLVARGLVRQNAEGNAKPVEIVKPLSKYTHLTAAQIARVGKVALVIATMTSARASDLAHKNPGWSVAYRGPNRQGDIIDMDIALQQVMESDPWLSSPLTAVESAAAFDVSGPLVDW